MNKFFCKYSECLYRDLSRKKLGPLASLILLEMMCNYVPGRGVIFCSKELLTEKTGLEVRAIRRVWNQIEKSKLLYREDKKSSTWKLSDECKELFDVE